MLDPRVLRIGLDARECGLRARSLDLELRHEHRRLATDALGVDHRSLVREEPEAGEVLDVVRIEEDVAGQAIAPSALEQALAPLLELAGTDAGTGLGELFHLLRPSLSRVSRRTVETGLWCGLGRGKIEPRDTVL